MNKDLNFRVWRTWTETDWEHFDHTIAEAKAAATTTPSDPFPAVHLFLSIRDNIKTLPIERRFKMGNTADDLLEAIRKGLTCDLFDLQKNCPYAPVRVLAESIKTSLDKDPGHQPREKFVELNFDRWESWGSKEWEAFEIEVSKALAAASTSTALFSLPGKLLQDINDNIRKLPEEKKREMVKLAHELIATCESTLERTFCNIRGKRYYLRETSPCKKRAAVFKVTVR